MALSPQKASTAEEAVLQDKANHVIVCSCIASLIKHTLTLVYMVFAAFVSFLLFFFFKNMTSSDCFPFGLLFNKTVI